MRKVASVSSIYNLLPFATKILFSAVVTKSVFSNAPFFSWSIKILKKAVCVCARTHVHAHGHSEQLIIDDPEIWLLSNFLGSDFPFFFFLVLNISGPVIIEPQQMRIKQNKWIKKNKDAQEKSSMTQVNCLCGISLTSCHMTWNQLPTEEGKFMLLLLAEWPCWHGWLPWALVNRN